MKPWDEIDLGRTLVGGTPYTETLKQMEEVFCRGMLLGYPTGDPSNAIHPHRYKSGWKEYDYSAHPFWLFDEWCSFTGRTWIMLLNEGIPPTEMLWIMHYEGWYEKETIPLLKLALATQYRGGFYGGRGPYIFTHPNHLGLVYRNSVVGTFRQFTARDEICNTKTGEKMGQHICWGGMLV